MIGKVDGQDSSFASCTMPAGAMLGSPSLLDSLNYLVFETTLPHLPSIKILALVVPLFLQAWLLLVEQTPTTRLIRKALIPFGVYYSYNITLYDFQPRIPFRAYVLALPS